MSNGLRKRNHYVPQMILKHFTNKQDKIFQFNALDKDWFKPNSNTNGEMTTEAVAKQNFLYIYEDENGKNDSIEILFGEMETEINRTINKLNELEYKKHFTDLKDILDNVTYDNLLYFLTIGFLRSARHLEEISKWLASIELEKLNVSRFYDDKYPLEIKHIDPRKEDVTVEIHNNAVLAEAFKEDKIKNTNNYFKQYTWFIFDNKTRFDFLINDVFINRISNSTENVNKIFVPIGLNKVLVGYHNVIHIFDIWSLKNPTKEFEKTFNTEEFAKECNFYTITNAYQFIYSNTKNEGIKNYINTHFKEKKFFVYSNIGQLEPKAKIVLSNERSRKKKIKN